MYIDEMTSPDGVDDAPTRRSVLKASGAAAAGLSALFVTRAAVPEAGATDVGHQLPRSSYATTTYVQNALTSLVHSENRFNVVTYGADPTGVHDSSAAVTAAQAALKAAHGGELFFPPGGSYRFATGIISRRVLADVKMSIQASGATLLPFGSGVAIDTQMTDPQYWAQPITPPLAPVVFGQMDCTGLTAGGIGVRHGCAVSAYYDGLVHNAAAPPTATWPTGGLPGARGWQLRNTKDTAGVPRWTEQTLFGPSAGVHNCYVGIEFDAYDGADSFGYTHMSRFTVEVNRAAQRGIVVRGSKGAGATFYGSQLHWQGNNSPPTTTTVGVIATSQTAGVATTQLKLSAATTVALYDGEVVILTDGQGAHPLAVMIRGTNPVGSTTISTYSFTPATSYAGGPVVLAAVGAVIGWPGPSVAGWSSGSAVDASSLWRSTLDWQMESGGTNTPLRTVALYVSPNATFDVFGYVDLTTYAHAAVQNYGALRVEGTYQGHIATSRDLSTVYLGPGIPGTSSVTLGESVPRVQVNDDATLTVPSGQPLMIAVAVQAGVPISYLGWFSGATGASSLENHWLALVDQTCALRAVTADLGPTIEPHTAYGAHILASTDEGTTYTPRANGFMYVVLCVVADEPPTVSGARYLPITTPDMASPGPLLASTAVQVATSAPSFPATFAPQSVLPVVPYAWIAGTL